MLGKKVLIVEDDRVVQGTWGWMFSKKGVCTYQAYTLSEAMDLFIKNRREIDLIILDGKLGDNETTLELIGFFRSNGYLEPRPIIAVSNDVDLRKKMLELGATHECDKPKLMGVASVMLSLQKAKER